MLPTNGPIMFLLVYLRKKRQKLDEGLCPQGVDHDFIIMWEKVGSLDV